VQAVRIDLRTPGIDFLVTPSNGDAPKDVGARTTSEFLAEFGCQVAINGSVFDAPAQQRGDPLDILGLSLSRGKRYSPPNRWDALLISKDRRAWIARSPLDTRKAFNGLSGFYALLLEGGNRGRFADQHPRTAAGVSRNGRYLILMTVDGRQPGYSEGTTTAETAEWIRSLGAYNALNLDGGGSTTLVIEDPDGKPLIVNRPSGPPPGAERRVANHLCVFAQRLKTRQGPNG
jgi:exopolysaccharide biosynthesis protein